MILTALVAVAVAAHLSTFDVVVAWGNWGLTVAAIAANLVAAHQVRPYRLLGRAVASLATIYAGSYLLLIIGKPIESWSDTMRAVSLLAWIVVWIGPAVWVRQHHARHHLLAAEVRRQLAAAMDDDEVDDG